MSMNDDSRVAPPRAWRLLRVVAGLTAATLCGPASPAAGHEYWLTLSRWAAAPGDTVAARAVVGTGFRGERRPFAAARCVRLVARTGQTLDLSRGATDGGLVWARLAGVDSGGAMLGYESNYTSIELPAAEFDEYLALEGLDA